MGVHFMSAFSCRLLSLRNSLKLRQIDAATAANVTVRAYQYYESAVKEPTLSVIAALADYFDVPADFLLGRKPFDHWEELQPRMAELRTVSAELFGLPRSLMENASLPEFIRLFGALYARAEIDPATGDLSLYPLIAPDSFQKR